MKREKGDRNQSKGTKVRRKSDDEIFEQSLTFYDNAEDLLKDNENDFYVNEDGNHDNKLEIVASSHPPLTDESHHVIVSSSFV
jgi:hypothetical protein